MSLRPCACVVLASALFLATLGNRPTIDSLHSEATAYELRGRSRDKQGHRVETDPVPAVEGAPSLGGEVETKAASDPEKNELKKDETGSPTSKDIEKIDKAVHEKVAPKMYTWPLAVRLVIVGCILLVPILIVSACMYYTPPERLSSSVYVKTALHCGFSFVVGWLNCIMLLRYRVFATMMVGNTILMGVAFICNSGFSQAKEDGYWWMGKRAQVLCPAQFDTAGHYAIMIGLFVLGSFMQGLLQKKLGWSSRSFAPIIAGGMIAVEFLEYLEVVSDSRWDVYLLSPIFGMLTSICTNCGIGSVPWSATGHIANIGYKLASWCTDFSHANLETVLVNLSLWVSFVSGIMMGTLFHSNRTVMLCALCVQGLIILNGMIYPSAAKDEATDAGVPIIDEDKTPAGADALPNYSTCHLTPVKAA